MKVKVTSNRQKLRAYAVPSVDIKYILGKTFSISQKEFNYGKFRFHFTRKDGTQDWWWLGVNHVKVLKD